MSLIHIDGISGTGKTTLAGELTRRGYSALDSDAAFGCYGNQKPVNRQMKKFKPIGYGI